MQCKAEENSGRKLSLNQVTVQYGSVRALRNVDLKVGGGERLGLVGLSGAGKTTLLRLFNGMVRPTSGHVLTLGQKLDSLSFEELRHLRSKVGFIHQELNLIPNLSVLHNVLAGKLGQISTARALLLFTFPSSHVLDEVYELLQRVGIAEKLHQRVDRLSGGQRQRVAIARALFQKPKVLLADEPVSSVDPARARSVLHLLTDLAGERKLTLCVSLHNLRLAQEFFPRLVGMKGGEIVFDQSPAALEEDQLQTLFKI
ncbi:MAG: phosphonate ABC transporter ATP-binding protein [Acidobacteriota bacterium]